MTLTHCTECKSQLSSAAHACPRCGHPARLRPPNSRWSTFITSVAILLGLAIFIVGAKEPKTTSSATPSGPAAIPMVGDIGLVKKGMFGCSDRKDMERLVELSHQGDDEAVSNTVLSRTFVGACRMLKLNARMYVEKSEPNGLVCARLRGETDCLWMPGTGLSEQIQEPTPQGSGR